MLVVLPERIGQAGIGVTAHGAVGDTGQLRHVRPHVAGAERTVQADRKRPGLRDRNPEGVDRLTRQRSPASIGDGHRDHQRQPDTLLLEHLLDRDNPGLRVERVDDGFEEQQVAATVDQASRLFLVRIPQLVEGHVAERRVVHVGRNREDAIGGAHRTRDEPRLVRGPGRPLVCGGAGQPRGGQVQLVHQRFERIVSLGDRVRVEAVRLDDVGACLEIVPVNAGDDVGTRQREHVAVPLEIARVIAKSIAAIVGLSGLVPLDHRPHCAVEHEDAPFEQGFERVSRVGRHKCSSSLGFASLRGRLGAGGDQHRERIA